MDVNNIDIESFIWGLIIGILIISVIWFIYEILEYSKVWELEE